MTNPHLDRLIQEFRTNAIDDKTFAQRVALACALIADGPLRAAHAPGAAIRAIFEVDQSQELQIIWFQ